MSKYLTLKDMPIEERPREKIVKYGVESLSTAELLAVLLRTGSREKTVLDLANEILGVCQGLKGLTNYSIEEFKQIEGIGLAKAAQLKAVVELSKKISLANVELTKISSPEDAVDLLLPRLKNQPQEKFLVVLLNTKYEVIAIKEVSRGSVNKTVVHPREVFRTAIKKNSTALILAHNHPSGDATPSEKDIELTRRLKKTGDIVGIEILDHLIIGDNKYKSLKTEDLF